MQQFTTKITYIKHKDTVTGETYITDGGNDYLRRSLNKVPAKDLTVTTKSPHADIREVFTWTRNFDADMNPLPESEAILLKDITDSHLDALVEWTSDTYPTYVHRIMIAEKEYRVNDNA